MKVAIIHDWLITYAGAERVLEQILKLFPDADLFCLIDSLPKESRKFLAGRKIKTSFLQKIPKISYFYRNLFPLFPLAIEQFDLNDYDVIISSSHCIAKGVITGPDQLHICYCHSPVRYAWDLQGQYLRESGISKGIKSWCARYFLHKFRLWDYRASAGVDYFLSNSKYIGRRIKKVYRRESITIYPCVQVDDFESCVIKDDYYVTCSRLVPYKRIDLIAKAFSLMPNKKLIIIGDGPDFHKIKNMTKPNIYLLGYIPFHELKQYLQKAKAFVYAAEEDFGIVPVEAQACGTPVIAYNKGGLTETVSNNLTGIFFYEQSVDSLIDAIKRFESAELLPPDQIREHACQFSTNKFKSDFYNFVISKWSDFKKNVPSHSQNK